MAHQTVQQAYINRVIPVFKESFGYTNALSIPRIKKVVVNIGTGKHVKDKAFSEHAANTLERITGQKPMVTHAKKAISNFKIREGQPIGLKVTLRGKRMYDFLERLVHITLPRIRDFQGLSTKGFDRQGNYTIGFKEYIAFPEIASDEIERLHGLEITIVMSTKNKEEGETLLRTLQFPLQKSS